MPTYPRPENQRRAGNKARTSTAIMILLGLSMLLGISTQVLADDPSALFDIRRVTPGEGMQMDWCRYRVLDVTLYGTYSGPTAGNRFCVECPGEGTCPGQPGDIIWFRVYRAGSLVAVLRTRVLTDECKDNCGMFPKYTAY